MPTMLEQYPDVDEFPPDMLLSMEKEMTGVYISGHPLEAYENELSNLTFNTQSIEELEEEGELALEQDGKRVRIGGIIHEIRTQSTKKNRLMSFLTLEDLTGQVECILFPQVHDRVLAYTQRMRWCL